MSNFPSNSFKSKENKPSEPGKTAHKVISGSASVKKPSAIEGIVDGIFQDDWSTIWTYILQDVVLPKLKDIFATTGKSIIDSLFYGVGSSPNRSSSNIGKISYRDYYDKPSRDISQGNGFSYKNLDFEDSESAFEVVRAMEESIETYHRASIGDLYDYAGLNAPYTYYKYGWKDFSQAEVKRTTDGRYYIKAPKAIPLD